MAGKNPFADMAIGKLLGQGRPNMGPSMAPNAPLRNRQSANIQDLRGLDENIERQLDLVRYWMIFPDQVPENIFETPPPEKMINAPYRPIKGKK